jgi:cell division protein FtsQ
MKIKMNIVYKVLTILMWTAISSGLMVLLVSAVRKERTMICKAVQVEFTDNKPFRMLDESEIISALWPDHKNAFPKGKKLVSVNLFALERQLEKNPWIFSADLFFDQHHVLHINVQQRTPVARLFTPEGSSVYMDENFTVLPVKTNAAVSLPVFSNFYISPAGANAQDSLLMQRVTGLAQFILADPFWMAQIEQVNINADYSFELVTQVGDQTIRLGNRSDWAAMLDKLKKVYRRISNENGWTKYSTIDLQFKDQVVCIKGNGIYQVPDSTKQTDSLNAVAFADSTVNIKNNAQTIKTVKSKL